MMKTRKILALLVTVCMMMTLLAPCLAMAEEKVVLTLIHHMGEQTKKDGLQAVIDAFCAQNPGVEFEVQGIDYPNYPTLLKTKIAAGDTPDIIFGRPYTYPELVEGGVFMDLTGQPFMERLNDFAVEGVTIGGKVWGLPLDLDIRSVYYNKAMFEAVGAKVPTTKTELIEACEKFIAAGQAPWSTPLKKTDLVDAWLTQIITPLVCDTNPDFFVKIQNGEGTFADEPKYAEALAALNETVLNYVEDGAFGIEENRGTENFASEKYPMIINGMWMLGDLRNINPEGSFGSMAFPWSDNPDENRLCVGLDDIFMAGADTEHKELVLKFFEFFVSDEGAKIWIDHSKLLSAVKGVDPTNPDETQAELLTWINAGKMAPMTAVQTLSGEYLQTYWSELQNYALLSAEERADVAAAVATLDDVIGNID